MSCLFRALAEQVGGTTQGWREDIERFLLTDPILGDLKASENIKFETGETLQAYVQRMRHANQWGGALEIKAFCNMTGRTVVLKHLRTGKETEFLPDKEAILKPPVVLKFTGSHYMARHESYFQEQTTRPLHVQNFQAHTSPAVPPTFHNNRCLHQVCQRCKKCRYCRQLVAP
jgi:hypothetical protein